MKIYLFSLVLLVAMLPGKAQLSGTYTIDPSGIGANNFTSFNNAVASLVSDGISASVTFNVSEGIYTEQVDIPQISGTSSSKTITFQPDPSNTSPVRVEYEVDSLDHYVWRISGADHLTIKGIEIVNTLDSVLLTTLVIQDSSQSVRIMDCFIESDGWNDLDYPLLHAEGSNDSLEIVGCELVGGRVGAVVVGEEDLTFLKIVGNTVRDHMTGGIDVRDYERMVITHNDVSSDTLTLNNGNTIGIRIASLISTEISHNRIGSDHGNGYVTGLHIVYFIGFISDVGKVYNNCITAGAATSTINSYGLRLFYSGLLQFFNNTMIVRSQGSGSSAFSTPYGGQQWFRNNIMWVQNGTAFDVGVFEIVGSDYNVYYSGNGNALKVGETSYNDLETYIEEYSRDSNSIIHSFDFFNDLECTLCDDTLDNSGDPVAWIPEDLNGVPRNPFTPDPGCVEFIDPSAGFFGNDTLICDDQVLLSLGGANAVTWSINGSSSSGTTALIENTGCEPETFEVAATVSSNACGIGNDDFELTLVPRPRLISDTTICGLDTLALTVCAGSGSDVLWSNGATSDSILITEEGTYAVQKSEAGCVMHDTVVIEASSLLVLADTELCEWDAPLVIDATIDGGLNYTWSGGDSVNSPINQFSSSGTYTLSVEDVYGCTQIDSMEVYVVGAPQATITTPAYSGIIYVFDASSSLFLTPESSVSWGFDTLGAVPSTSTNVSETVVFPWTNPADPRCNHHIELQIDNGCGVDVATMIIRLCGGMEDRTDHAFLRLFPNPTDEYVSFRIDAEQLGKSVVCLNSLGQEVFNEVLKTTEGQLDVSQLPAGVYVLRWSDSSSGGQRLIVR